MFVNFGEVKNIVVSPVSYLWVFLREKMKIEFHQRTYSISIPLVLTGSGVWVFSIIGRISVSFKFRLVSFGSDLIGRDDMPVINLVMFE